MDIIPALTVLNMVFEKERLDVAAVQPVINGFFLCSRTKSGKSQYQQELDQQVKRVGSVSVLKDVELHTDDESMKQAKKHVDEIWTDFIDKLRGEIKQ